MGTKFMAHLASKDINNRLGFTVVELLVVIVVIGVLATIVYISYSGVQQRAQTLKLQDDMNSVESILESYAFSHDGTYPVTTGNGNSANWQTIDVRRDINCFNVNGNGAPGNNGTPSSDWVPGVGTLPQSVPNTGSNVGVDNSPGCYLYASNGSQYVLSAWNMLSQPSTSSPFYRRFGFREFQSENSTQFFTCNNAGIGGVSGGTYNIADDYYKHSLTISNITGCDETPPSGA